MQVDLSQSLIAVSRNPYLRRAVGDFRSAIRYPGETGFLTYRAIESLIQDVKIKHNIPDRKKPGAIKILVKKIDIDFSDIEFLRSMAGDVRHGKPAWISGEDRIKCLNVARNIIMKYMSSAE